MTNYVLFATLALGVSICHADTTVAVLEFGKRGAVRRTTAKTTESTVEGVASFWSALHSPVRKLQHTGMTVVPDLFNKADSGIVIGVSGSGVDLDSMPTVLGLVSDESKANVVGHMEIPGSSSDELMSKVPDWDGSDTSSLVKTAKKEAGKVGLSGIKTVVNADRAEEFDNEIKSLVAELEQLANSSSIRLVVHLVIEEEASSSRRRALSRRLTESESSSRRRLEDEEGEEEEQEEEEENADGNGNQYDGYYGYGYYNAYGEWVTPYKTMFQIQYFNVVFWTGITLTFTLFYVINKMLNMPLEPDTLLFGESSKLVGDE